MGEMSNEEIEQRFNEIVDGIDGKCGPVAEMTTASELLDEQQRILVQRRRLVEFLLDLKDAERDLRLHVNELGHEAEMARLKNSLATNSGDRAEIEELKDPMSKMRERLGAAAARLDQLKEHQRRVLEFQAEILKTEESIRDQRQELSL